MTSSTDIKTRYKLLLDSFPVTHFLFIVDRDGVYLDLRVPDPSRLWIPEAEHLGKKFDEVIHEELAGDRRYYFNKAIATNKIQQYSYPHPVTENRHMTCIITPIKTGNEEPEEFLIQVFDTALAAIPAANVLPPTFSNHSPAGSDRSHPSTLPI